MASYVATTSFIPNFFDDNGNLLSGGTLEAFIAGTSTPTGMFVDEVGTAAGTVITLNARGEPETTGNSHQVWIDSAIEYDFILKDSSGVTINTPQNVAAAGLGSIAAVTTVAVAKALTTLSDGQGLYIQGYTVVGDGGGGIYHYDASSTATANDGTILALDTLAGRLIYSDVAPATVKTFGAVGDGVADDTAAINAASTFAVNNNKTLVCGGVSLLKADWVIPDGLTFRAIGLTITRVSSQPSINHSVDIKGVTWDAQSNQTALVVTGYDNWVLSKCNFINATKFGLEGGESNPPEDFKLIRCTASNNGSSVTTEDSGIFLYGKRGLLAYCEANDNNGSGIVLRNNSNRPTVDVQFIGCQAHRNTRHGFLTSIIDITPPWTRANSIKFVTCTANDNGDHVGFLYSGFALHELEDSDVIGCNASGNGEHGITFQDGRYNRLSGGTFSNNNQSGLRVQGNFGRTEDSETGEQGSVFSNARLDKNGNVGVTSNTVNGVTIQANCQNNTYSNLRCTNNLEHGIRFQAKSSYTDNKNEIIDNCVLTGNGIDNNVQVDTNAALIRGSYYSSFGSDLVKKALSGEQSSSGIVSQDISTTGSSLALIDRGEIYNLSWTNASNAQVSSISSAWEGHKVSLIFDVVTGGGVLSILNSVSLDLGNTLSSPYTVTQGDVLTFVRISGVWKLISTT